MKQVLWAVPLLAVTAWAAATAPADAELIRMRAFLEHLELLEAMDMLDEDPTIEAAVAATQPTPSTAARKERKHGTKK